MKRILHIVVLVLACIGVVSCSSRPKEKEKYSQTKHLMGVYIQVDTCMAQVKRVNIEHVYGRIWQRLEDIAWRMNVYDEKSDVALINNSFPAPATVGEDTYGVIKQSLQVNYLTEGTFDITVLPLIELWVKAHEDNVVPSEADVKLAKEAVGPSLVNLLADNQIQLSHPSAKIDLGGIGVGYAVDEVARLFREAGIENFYIDAGGDIYAGGFNCQGKKWRIGIKDPKIKENLLAVVELTNAGITTSGNYERHFDVKGQPFSHIINPVTGYPQQGVISATVIAPTCIEADAMATALTVMGAERGNGLIDRLGMGYASIIVSEETGGSSVYPSENFNNIRLIQD